MAYALTRAGTANGGYGDWGHWMSRLEARLAARFGSGEATTSTVRAASDIAGAVDRHRRSIDLMMLRSL